MCCQNVDHLLIDMEQVLLRCQTPMATLKLAAYAADAMRVQRVLGQHADMSKSFDQTLKSACPDWRNPGSTSDPADLISVALAHAATALQEVLRDADQAVQAMHQACLSGGDRHTSVTGMT